MTETYHTFLIPIIFELNNSKYLCWGYREEDGEVVGFTATQANDTKWTDATFFTDKKLVEEFKKYLPEKPVKRKRKKN